MYAYILYVCMRTEKSRHVRICIFLYALMNEVLEFEAVFLDSERIKPSFLNHHWSKVQYEKKKKKKEPTTLPLFREDV